MALQSSVAMFYVSLSLILCKPKTSHFNNIGCSKLFCNMLLSEDWWNTSLQLQSLVWKSSHCFVFYVINCRNFLSAPHEICHVEAFIILTTFIWSADWSTRYSSWKHCLATREWWSAMWSCLNRYLWSSRVLLYRGKFIFFSHLICNFCGVSVYICVSDDIYLTWKTLNRSLQLPKFNFSSLWLNY